MVKNKTNRNVKREVIQEIHRPARKNFKRRHVIVKSIKDLMQADLVEMQKFSKINKGFRYILVLINVFSKYLWAFPLKSKTGKEVANVIENVFKVKKNVVKNLQTDMGKEFYNSDFKKLMVKYNINHYSTYSVKKASVVERVNRTLKNMMWEEFSYQGNYKWLAILPELVKKYNQKIHRTIGMKPAEVNSRNEKEILETAYTHKKIRDPKFEKFKLGDFVRISKYREAFDKGYTPNWSNEIFKITKIQNTFPVTYILSDNKNEMVQGGFYKEDLQKVKYSDVYLVERILRRKGNRLYIKWLGLDNSQNSWINKNDFEG